MPRPPPGRVGGERGPRSHLAGAPRSSGLVLQSGGLPGGGGSAWEVVPVSAIPAGSGLETVARMVTKGKSREEGINSEMGLTDIYTIIYKRDK